MDNSIYIATSRQGVMFRKLDVLANNLANMNTPAFKDNVTMITDWTVNNGNQQYVSFAQDVSLFRDARTGALKQTSNPLDIAIDGPGYLTIQTPQGNRYTRAGDLKLDPNGTLVTHDGFPLLDVGGQPILIPDNIRELSFGDDATVRGDGNVLGELALVQFDDDQKMERAGLRMYRTDQQPRRAEGVRIAQGYIEESNVEPVVELAEMIKTNRGVSGVTKFIETAYDLEQRAMRAWSGNGNN